MFTAQDHVYMARALQLAAQGLYSTSPNPRVGCVIVKNGSVIGEGAHLKAGEPHAEVFALQQASTQAKGATVYVTLEPCSHTGRTPPCAHALVQAGVTKVIVAMQDPNPLVVGQGTAYLQANGIAVEVGLMQTQSAELNAGFISRMTRSLPFVRSKIACSLDGKTALNNGESQWITGEPARRDVQRWRAQSCAMLTGIGTVLGDNPRLNVRDIAVSSQPLRVIVDSQLQISPDAAILQSGNALVAYAIDAQDKNGHLKTVKLAENGVKLIQLPDAHGKVCLKSLLSHLAHRQINNVMVEGGAGINGALIAQRLIDELLIYQAPIVLGDKAKGMFDLAELSSMQQKIQLKILESRQFGIDTRLRASICYADQYAD